MVIHAMLPFSLVLRESAYSSVVVVGPDEDDIRGHFEIFALGEKVFQHFAVQRESEDGRAAFGRDEVSRGLNLGVDHLLKDPVLLGFRHVFGEWVTIVIRPAQADRPDAIERSVFLDSGLPEFQHVLAVGKPVPLAGDPAFFGEIESVEAERIA